MKKMEYKYTDLLDHHYEILHEGEINGRKFKILSLGTHPTAYVELKAEELEKSQRYQDYHLAVHGDFTYMGNLSHALPNDNTIYIGWDYAHYGDFTTAYTIFLEGHEHRYCTEEIFDEVKSVIEQFGQATWKKNDEGHWILSLGGIL